MKASFLIGFVLVSFFCEAQPVQDTSKSKYIREIEDLVYQSTLKELTDTIMVSSVFECNDYKVVLQKDSLLRLERGSRLYYLPLSRKGLVFGQGKREKKVGFWIYLDEGLIVEFWKNGYLDSRYFIQFVSD